MRDLLRPFTPTLPVPPPSEAPARPLAGRVERRRRCRPVGGPGLRDGRAARRPAARPARAWWRSVRYERRLVEHAPRRRPGVGQPYPRLSRSVPSEADDGALAATSWSDGSARAGLAGWACPARRGRRDRARPSSATAVRERRSSVDAVAWPHEAPVGRSGRGTVSACDVSTGRRRSSAARPATTSWTCAGLRP